MDFIKHLLKRHLCVENIYIQDSNDRITPSLKCKRCKTEIGFLYSGIEGWKVFLHTKFKRYKPEIRKWAYQYTKDRNPMDNTYEQKWKEVLHSIKQWYGDGVLSAGEECEEDSKSYKPDESRTIYRIVEGV